jgi:hypothetical protein
MVGVRQKSHMDNSQTGLAGEFYTLAQLTQRGCIATLTLGNTKGVDILVTNQELNKLYKVEVKTTQLKPRRESLFGKELMYMWPMNAKHENIVDQNLLYCFVVLSSPDEQPAFFIVPSESVAKYVKWQHQHWINSRKKKVQATKMRRFRIELSDPNKFKNNWSVFQK